jgi:hypothetical protein
MIEALTGQWIGVVRGTDAGNIFATITADGDRPKVAVSANLPEGIVKLSGPLEARDGILSAVLTPEGMAEGGGPLPRTRVVFDQVGPARLAGRWSSEAGNEGVLFLDRADTAPRQGAESAVPAKPIEIVAREGALPNLTLLRPELEALIAKLKSLSAALMTS